MSVCEFFFFPFFLSAIVRDLGGAGAAAAAGCCCCCCSAPASSPFFGDCCWSPRRLFCLFAISFLCFSRNKIKTLSLSLNFRVKLVLMWFWLLLVSSAQAFVARSPASGRPQVALSAIEVGNRIRVVASDITFWHHPKHKEGLNPEGCEGTVKRIATVPRDGASTPISANRPICVMLEDPRMLAHFEEEEIVVIASLLNN